MTSRVLPSGYVLDDDPARIDVSRTVRYLTTSTFWGKERPPLAVERGVRNAFRVVGLYRDGDQVGFCRAVSDGEIVAYLADVYVEEAHHGQGLGVELVREMVDKGPLAHVRWMLHTLDAHDLYRKFGFTDPKDSYMERPHAGWGGP